MADPIRYDGWANPHEAPNRQDVPEDRGRVPPRYFASPCVGRRQGNPCS
jgi:hypothetical protein